ncbi:hypothetical protein BU24DRAFT_464331 [Aaosphaeria arxii CBS 175.79]|uniref:Uncharacterized protein n=1 Tax=Aaosphaeria arxii CBS 175.79 TaxID=1450172 RepID=A0A6A5XKU6_9PLEO|nr:uncharacterized protein BU24DRAFT_464331 [Aaosphaeria arxii CBS 175.79]KAF2013563.1 hypothetical protein BU24DRAFT_464331 [Aaosphaeria arxii CBS 175.79]
MDYYFCPADELRQELQRRGYAPHGGQDELSENLKKDDEARGTEATTIQTLGSAHMGPKLKLRIAANPNSVHPNLLVGEKITHWTLNTFFPTLQLFFESGLSCTIEGGFRQSAAVGIERNLRFRLTDLTHEEDGFVVNSTLPRTRTGSSRSIKILEAVVAERTSVAVMPVISHFNGIGPPNRPQKTIGLESHLVIGLRLEGMQKMGFIWARIDSPSSPWGNALGTWADVRVVGLRDDVPAPFVGFPQRQMKMGAQTHVVMKTSMITGDDGLTNGKAEDKFTHTERFVHSQQRMNSESPAPGQRQWGGGGKTWGGGGKFTNHELFMNAEQRMNSPSPMPAIRHW